MAAKWYLLHDEYDQTSGFEEIDHSGFSNILGSEVAQDVELYNYDLTKMLKTKAIIQERMTDTKLKTLNRHALLPIGTCHAGMYVKYRDIFWLIVGIVDNNGIYEKAVMTFCNYKLTWMNEAGQVVQRWANVSSASQYNNGETTSAHYYDRTDQLMISMPDDDESLMLKTGDRFVVDRRCKVYEKDIPDDVLVDTSRDLIVYRLTRSDTVLYDYQNSGYFQFLIYQDEKRDTDGYYVINNKGYWLCDPVFNHVDETKSSDILADAFILYPDGLPEKFTAVFRDMDNTEVDETPIWEIASDYADKLDVSYDGKSILISTSDLKLINKSFELILKCDGYEDKAATIYIRSFI